MVHKYSNEGSYWFKRFLEELMKISTSITVKKIKFGFYRIYWRGCYVHEVYKDMPMVGYDIERYDPRLENRGYFEEFEDNAELIRKVKNYVEGFYDSLKTIKTRIYMMRHDEEYFRNAYEAYKVMTVK